MSQVALQSNPLVQLSSSSLERIIKTKMLRQTTAFLTKAFLCGSLSGTLDNCALSSEYSPIYIYACDRGEAFPEILVDMRFPDDSEYPTPTYLDFCRQSKNHTGGHDSQGERDPSLHPSTLQFLKKGKTTPELKKNSLRHPVLARSEPK